MSIKDQRFLTIDEVAAHLKVTPACIRRWILVRKITIVKVGRLVRIPHSEVVRIIEEGLRPAQNRIES